MVIQRSAAVLGTASFISAVLTQPYSGQEIIIELCGEPTFEASAVLSELACESGRFPH